MSETYNYGEPIVITTEDGEEVRMEMINLPSGKFMMGSDPSEEGSFRDEQPKHEVTIPDGLAMSQTVVTQAMWVAVMGELPKDIPEEFLGPDLPVVNVSWYDCQEFCKKLSEMTGRKFDLPSESVWEYACRAGSTTRYHFGDDPAQLGEYAWFYSNSNNRLHPVAQKKPNRWGFFDMHGNVWEWCKDLWHSNYDGAPTDGSAWE